MARGYHLGAVELSRIHNEPLSGQMASRKPICCAGPPNRRDFLRVGGLTALGLCLTNLFGPRGCANTSTAKSCILLWLDGGPSHLETLDPKPDAPSEVRGPFRSIATNVPGIELSECLSLNAKVMDKVAIMR